MRGEIAPRKILNVKRQRSFGLSVFSICKLYKWDHCIDRRALWNNSSLSVPGNSWEQFFSPMSQCARALSWILAGSHIGNLELPRNYVLGLHARDLTRRWSLYFKFESVMLQVSFIRGRQLPQNCLCVFISNCHKIPAETFRKCFLSLSIGKFIRSCLSGLLPWT